MVEDDVVVTDEAGALAEVVELVAVNTWLVATNVVVVCPTTVDDVPVPAQLFAAHSRTPTAMTTVALRRQRYRLSETRVPTKATFTQSRHEIWPDDSPRAHACIVWSNMNRTVSEDEARALALAVTAALAESGYRSRLAPIHLVEQMRQTLVDLREQGLVSEKLSQEYRLGREFSPPPEVPEPRTLVVVAYPSPAVRVRFQLASGPLEAVIPPTYISTSGAEQALEILRSLLEPAGHSVARARVPVKLLAVRSGLAHYGRNNVAYVRNLGSLVRLDVFCTDADLGAQEYKTKASQLMSCCPPCRNCHHVCPTGCIPLAGTVIDAARCLTYLNEREGEWPDWLDPRAHNSLVGCMLCQELCPANRYYLRIQKVVAEFDRGETEIILENLPPEQLPERVRVKLKELDLEEYSTVLGRNLLALAEAQEGSA